MIAIISKLKLEQNEKVDPKKPTGLSSQDYLGEASICTQICSKLFI